MADLQSGADGEPLPGGVLVIRIAELTDTGDLSEVTFALSSAERECPRPRLSVWAEALTTPDQMWRLSGGKPADTHYVELGVDAIRAAAEVAPDAVTPLDVEWEPIADERRDWPGASGHAGTSGLDRGACPIRRQRMALRSRLKDFAEGTVTAISKALIRA